MTPTGLEVYEPPSLSIALAGQLLGLPGDVVDGTAGMTPMTERACWLDNAGDAFCASVPAFGPDPMPVPTVAQVFTKKNVLALAGNFYSDSLCAVYEDGSIACTGSNQQGQLGVGNTDYLLVEAEVQPAGSVDTTCK